MARSNWLAQMGRWFENLVRRATSVADRGWQPLFGGAAVTPRRPPTAWELVDAYRDTAYYCANLNARAVARTPLRLFVRTRPGEPAPKCLVQPVGKRLRARLHLEAAGRRLSTREEVDEVLDHPLLDLLHAPTHTAEVGGLSRFELFELTQLSLEIVGRAYWYVTRDGLGVPIGLWPLAAQHVQPVADPSGGRLLDHYLWTGERAPRRLAPTDVVAFRTPDLRDPFLGGLSPAAASHARLALAEMHLAHQHALLDNRARPDVVISPSQPEGMLGDAEARRLEEAFARRFRAGGSGGVFVSRDSLKIDPLTFPPRDLGDLAETQASLEQIARAFDVPLAMLHRDANRASAEQGRAQHASDAVAPRLVRIADRLNLDLVPRFDPTGRLFLRFDDPVQENLVLKLRTRALHLRLGVTTINEERAEDGYPPVPWGDEPWTAHAGIPGERGA